MPDDRLLVQVAVAVARSWINAQIFLHVSFELDRHGVVLSTRVDIYSLDNAPTLPWEKILYHKFGISLICRNDIFLVVNEVGRITIRQRKFGCPPLFKGCVGIDALVPHSVTHLEFKVKIKVRRCALFFQYFKNRFLLVQTQAGLSDAISGVGKSTFEVHIAFANIVVLDVGRRTLHSPLPQL